MDYPRSTLAMPTGVVLVWSVMLVRLYDITFDISKKRLFPSGQCFPLNTAFPRDCRTSHWLHHLPHPHHSGHQAFNAETSFGDQVIRPSLFGDSRPEYPRVLRFLSLGFTFLQVYCLLYPVPPQPQKSNHAVKILLRILDSNACESQGYIKKLL